VNAETTSNHPEQITSSESGEQADPLFKAWDAVLGNFCVMHPKIFCHDFTLPRILRQSTHVWGYD